METFKKVINKSLKTKRALELLNLPIENFETKIPILPSGGEIYLYRAKTHRDIDGWRKDGYRWCNRGTSVMTINRNPVLRKSFFYLMTKEGQKNGFQKHVYRLFDSEDKVVIHYLGDETLNTSSFDLTKESKNLFPYRPLLLPSTSKGENSSSIISGARKKPGTSEVYSNHFINGFLTVINPLPTMKFEPPTKDKEDKKKSVNSLKSVSKPHKSIIERNLFNKTQDKYREQQQKRQQQQKIVKLSETVKSALQRSSNKVLEQLQSADLAPRRKQRKAISYEMVQIAQQMVDQGKNNKEIQQLLNLSKNATLTLIKKIVEQGDEFVKNFNPTPQRSSASAIRDQEIKRKIEIYLSADASLTQNAILEKLKKDGIITSQPQISKILKSMKGYFCEKRHWIEQGVENSRNEKLFKSMLYQMTPQTQNKPQQNISAALGKPVNTERSRKSPLNIVSTSNSMVEATEVENASPPAKKPREIHIDIDVSEEESPVVSKPLLQPTIEPPVQKSVTTSMKSTPAQPSSIVHNSLLDINVPQKQKRILVVPNHQQSVMSNLSSLWKAGRFCDAFIGNGTVNLKVHKMILGAVCPKVLDVFYSTPQHKLPKVTFPNTVSKEALLAFAEYMYNGVLDLDPDLLSQMKIIAQQLDMKDFEQLCNNQLKSSFVPNMLPTILEPMLNEPCSSSGLIQQMSPQDNQTSIMKMIPTSNRACQKDVHNIDSLNTISTAVSNCSNSVSLSNLPLVEVRAETEDTLIETVNNNLAPSIVNNICDINMNSKPQVKIEEVDPEDQQQYGRESVSSSINYSTSDSIITSNFTHFSNPDLSQSSSSPISTSQHTDSSILNKSLPGGHIWKQNNKDKRNTVEDVNNTDPYPISLFTANWSNLPLLTKEIKKEYNVE